ncbi:13542_t:CDS:2 [Ambispora leptoticha]|uniref:13542_t:CDS:1 n=1 Tax=Ambispora leptoticha TaxID=144679 RepID=A0A9N9G065_9GLOM|nr:13542_t:CDS:2 [Ambispora leptoticha]
MKFQSIILALTAGLAFVIHAQACTLFLNGTNMHQTGNTGGGCFGLDPTDPINKATVSNPGTSYVFYSDTNCNGTAVATGKDTTAYNPPITASSVNITCPPGT